MAKKQPTQRPKRRIKSAKISLISLVPRGANQTRSLFKDRDAIELSAIAKLDVEGYLTAIVYRPDSTDSQGDVADHAAIKQAAHDFLANMEGNGIDVLHDCEPVGNDRAQICETFIVQKNDPRFANITDDQGEPIDATGAWAVIIKIHDPDLQSRYATGEWVGVSMYGDAVVEPILKRPAGQPTQPQESKVDEKQMAELLKQFGATLSATIVEGLSKALKPVEVPAPAPVEPVAKSVPFEGDYSDPAAIAAHAEKVLFASLDMSKTADIVKWQAHLAKKAADAAPNPNEGRINELESELRKLRGAPAAGGEPSRGTTEQLTVAQKLAKGAERAARLKKDGVIL